MLITLFEWDLWTLHLYASMTFFHGSFARTWGLGRIVREGWPVVGQHGRDSIGSGPRCPRWPRWPRSMEPDPVAIAEVWTDHLKKLQDCAPKDSDTYVKAMLEAGDGRSATACLRCQKLLWTLSKGGVWKELQGSSGSSNALFFGHWKPLWMPGHLPWIWVWSSCFCQHRTGAWCTHVNASVKCRQETKGRQQGETTTNGNCYT